MTNNPPIIPEDITLFHIHVSECEIHAPTPMEHRQYNINVRHKLMHNLNDDRIKVTLEFDILDKEDEDKGKARFTIEFHFQVKKLNHFYTLDEKNNPVFNGMFVATLLGLSLSTARGMIYERLRSTNMKNIIIPIVSPQKMLAKNKNK